MKARLLTVVMTMALLTVHPAEAQRQQQRSTARGAAPASSSIALSGGAGVGWTRPACSYCRRSMDAGPVMYLEATSQLNPRFALGGQANLWARNSDVFVLMGTLGVVAHMYPNPASPLFLKAGLGYLTYRAYDSDGDLVSNGPAIQLGAGYRFQFSNGLAITNFANLLTSRYGTLRSDDEVLVENMGVTSIQLGIAISRY
jgi:hypothetical protein